MMPQERAFELDVREEVLRTIGDKTMRIAELKAAFPQYRDAITGILRRMVIDRLLRITLDNKIQRGEAQDA